jgi:hypothetical protein
MAFLTMEVQVRHARTRAIKRGAFLLQMALFALCGMRRAASRVSFLMCQFCVRAAVAILATPWLQSECCVRTARTAWFPTCGPVLSYELLRC